MALITIWDMNHNDFWIKFLEQTVFFQLYFTKKRRRKKGCTAPKATHTQTQTHVENFKRATHHLRSLGGHGKVRGRTETLIERRARPHDVYAHIPGTRKRAAGLANLKAQTECGGFLPPWVQREPLGRTGHDGEETRRTKKNPTKAGRIQRRFFLFAPCFPRCNSTSFEVLQAGRKAHRTSSRPVPLPTAASPPSSLSGFSPFFFFLYRLTLGSAALVMSSPQAQVSASSAGMRGQRSQRQRCRARSKATGAVWRN